MMPRRLSVGRTRVAVHRADERLHVELALVLAVEDVADLQSETKGKERKGNIGGKLRQGGQR